MGIFSGFVRPGHILYTPCTYIFIVIRLCDHLNSNFIGISVAGLINLMNTVATLRTFRVMTADNT